MLERMHDLPGEELSLRPYLKEFADRFRAVRNAPVWKIERQQDFDQPESESWVAFSQGREEESLRLLERNRAGLREQFARITAAGSSVRRVRVVEEPLTRYLYWELHSLRLRAQCGERIRVVGPERIASLEEKHRLPEIVTLGESLTYRILYDAQGVLAGAVRYTDPEVNAGCRADIAALHREAEELVAYFDRAVANAGAPSAC